MCICKYEIFLCIKKCKIFNYRYKYLIINTKKYIEIVKSILSCKKHANSPGAFTGEKNHEIGLRLHVSIYLSLTP